MALARFGAKRINSYEDVSDTKPESVQCRLQFVPTAKALMRSHLWRFAKDQAQLSQDTVTPTFQWAYRYHLPNDYLRTILLYDGSDPKNGQVYTSFELMDDYLYTDESEVYMKYIRWVESVAKWDSLFVQVMALSLAQKLVIPISQSLKLKADIDQELFGTPSMPGLMSRVRAMDRTEGEHIGRYGLQTWNDARYSNIA